MLIVAMNALTDAVSVAAGRVVRGRTRLLARDVYFPDSGRDNAQLPFPSLLLRVADQLLGGIDGVQQFLIASGPATSPTAARWEECYRDYADLLERPVTAIDGLQALALNFLADRPIGTELFPIMGEQQGFASAGYRLAAPGVIETVLEPGLRSLDEIVLRLRASPRPVADHDKPAALWRDPVSRFGCGLGFVELNTLHRGLLTELPLSVASGLFYPNAAQLLTSFAAQHEDSPLPSRGVVQSANRETLS
jgi:hypothetical protein